MDQDLLDMMELYPPVWVKDNLKEVPLADMSNAHISNCIREIEAGNITRWGCNGYTTAQWLLIFKQELVGRNMARAFV